MAISFVAAVNSFVSGTSLTINKPSGTTTDDILVLAIGGHAAAQRTLTVPSGWTVKRSFFTSGETNPSQIIIAYKKATASEGADYAFTMSGTVTGVATLCAYRGATGTFLAENATADTGGQPLPSPTVNNTQSTAWRITFGAMILVSPTGLYSQSSDEVQMRSTLSEVGSGSLVIGSHYRDSNGAIATGNTSRTYNLSGSNTWSSAAVWIGILEEGSALPASGSFNATCGQVTASGAGEVHDDATMAMTLSPVTMAGAGYGQPPPVDGTMNHQLPSVVMAGEGGTDVRGELATLVLPSINIVAETRVFGIRVIAVEAEDRTIVVQPRSLDD